jgi:hypothetical protein
MIRNYICNRRIISGSISFEKEEMKQPGCPGIYSGCGLVDTMKNILPRST